MDKRLVKMSKFLSFVLRHHPEAIGLSLDTGGWVSVNELLAAAKRAGKTLDEKLLREVVEQNDKNRFSLSDDGLRIRANQGHSIAIDLGIEPIKPPGFLFHGTATRFVESIKRNGLIRGNRHHVHLSVDHTTAIAVGKRYGKPIVLTIQAGRMHECGFEFYLSENGVWLTERVLPEYIGFPKDYHSK